MADGAVSLTIGVVALASLFSTCIECFDYFKAGQKLEEDLEILLVKLDLEKTRLLIWGNAVGVLKAEDDEGRAASLDDDPNRELLVKSLLSNADKLQNAYGLRAINEAETKAAKSSNIVSANSMNVFKTSYRRFWVRFASAQSKSGLLMKTKWAIHDKSKFEGLIVHLRDFIDGLNQVLPVRRETQDQIVHGDIASILDLSKLRLVQSASNLFDYIPSLQGDGKIYFTLTGLCRQKASGSLCNMSKLKYPSSPKLISHVSEHSNVQWGIGTCIADSLSVNDFTSVDLDALISQRSRDESGELDELETALLKQLLPLATIYVYCAPCACLVATAMNICLQIDNYAKTFFRFLVRPDDRLVSSCCSKADRSIHLGDLVEAIRKDEASWTVGSLDVIDRWWVEQRLFEIEATDQSHLLDSVSDLAKGIFKSHRSRTETAGIVILGELDYCLPIMQRAPFPPESRIPRETEIFEMFPRWSGTQTVWKRNFLGKYTPQVPPAQATNTSSQVGEINGQSSQMQSLTPAIPIPVTTRQISPSLSPASKRQKSTADSSIALEDMVEESPGR